MRGLSVDEGEFPALHRWMVSARILMHAHPRVGASRYAQWLGLDSTIRAGWNRIVPPAGSAEAAVFVFAGPDGGVTTADQPGIPDGDIHDVHADALPSLETSFAWRQLIEVTRLALAKRELAHLEPQLRETVEAIAQAGARPLHGGEDARANARVARALQEIRAVVDTVDTSVDTFVRPLVAIVDDVLSFRLGAAPGAAVIATLLARYALSYPNPMFPPNGTATFLAQADHVAELATTIGRRRDEYSLGGWAQLTYLAYLLAAAALSMYENGAPRAADPEVRRLLERRALYVDELLAHDITPSLFYPLAWMPLGGVEYGAARARDLTRARGVYRPAAAAVAAGAEQPDGLWEHVAAYSRQAPAADVDAFLTRDVLLCPPLRQNLQLFLLTMSAGRSGA